MLGLNTELSVLQSYFMYPFPGQEGYFLLGHGYVGERNLPVLSWISLLFGAAGGNSRYKGDEGTGKSRSPSTGSPIPSCRAIA